MGFRYMIEVKGTDAAPDDITLRVAKALTKNWLNAHDTKEAAWDSLSLEVQTAYMDQARVAIETVQKVDSETVYPQWTMLANGLYTVYTKYGRFFKATDFYGATISIVRE
jgi:hypothetical protein